MPGSSQVGKREALEMLAMIEDELETILDVGPGRGQWYDLLRPWYPDATFDAVEIFLPYVNRYGLMDKYETIYRDDAFSESFGVHHSQYDLVIFGDVLEHVEKERGIAGVKRLLRKWGLLSIPLGECPQEATEENPYEEHVATWTIEEVYAAFPVVGAFIGNDPFVGDIGLFLMKGDHV